MIRHDKPKMRGTEYLTTRVWQPRVISAASVSDERPAIRTMVGSRLACGYCSDTPNLFPLNQIHKVAKLLLALVALPPRGLSSPSEIRLIVASWMQYTVVSTSRAQNIAFMS